MTNYEFLKNAELEEYYKNADVGSLMFERSEYMDMAKPFKSYEYLAHEIPALSTKGTAIGSFVEQNDIGWNIEFEAGAISRVLQSIIEKPSLLSQKIQNCKIVKQNNLWITRADAVARELKKDASLEN